MIIDLSHADVLRILYWAAGCDGESYIDERDWPLIVRLSEAIKVDPASAAPEYARDAGVDPSPHPRAQFEHLN